MQLEDIMGVFLYTEILRGGFSEGIIFVITSACGRALIWMGVLYSFADSMIIFIDL